MLPLAPEGAEHSLGRGEAEQNAPSNAPRRFGPTSAPTWRGATWKVSAGSGLMPLA